MFEEIITTLWALLREREVRGGGGEGVANLNSYVISVDCSPGSTAVDKLKLMLSIGSLMRVVVAVFAQYTKPFPFKCFSEAQWSLLLSLLSLSLSVLDGFCQSCFPRCVHTSCCCLAPCSGHLSLSRPSKEFS